MAHKFVITKDKRGEYRVNFKYNAETVFQTEGYSSNAGAHRAIESIKQHVPGATVDDQSAA
ncbi:MAG TPA: DUF1508 domain-containing protein [Sphingomonas sp.]|nr:DUF1508 domain-containing protein [Sphingomonas sp.]